MANTASAIPVAYPDATGKIYTVDDSLKPGSTVVLFINGTQAATTTATSTGSAVWTLASRPAGGAIVTYDGVFTGSGGTVETLPATYAFRAHGHRFRICDTFGGAANWAQGCRLRVYAPAGATGRVKMFWPTFTRSGTNFGDLDFPYDTNFQGSIQKGWTNAYTGLTPRTSFLTNGSKTASYIAASPQGPGILSDTLDLGPVNTGDPMDVWGSMEFAAKASQGTSKLPTGLFVGTTKYNVCEVVKLASTSLVDLDWCASATNVNGENKANTGTYTPLLLWEVTDDKRCVWANGNSILWGTGENDLTVTTDGDFRGNADGYLGLFDRWMQRTGLMFVNAGKPTDQAQWQADPAKTVRRRQMAALCGVTDLYYQDPTNDVFGRTTTQMQTDLQAIFSAFGTAIQTATGKTPLKTAGVMMPKSTNNAITALSASGTTVTATSAITVNVGDIVIVSGATPTTYNGTVTVTGVGSGTFTYTAATAPASSPATGSNIQVDDRLIRANGVNQVTFPAFGAGSKAETINNMIKALQVGNDKFVDLSLAVRYGTNQDFWLTEAGSPYAYTRDKIHPNSRGHAKIAAEAPAYPTA